MKLQGASKTKEAAKGLRKELLPQVRKIGKNQRFTPAGRAGISSATEGKALCEMTDRSRILEPVILLADRNYSPLNNLARLENRGWKYAFRLMEREPVLA